MRRVWLIGGTADARALADRLVDQGYSLLATLATEQGGQLWPARPGLEPRVGRLDEQAMDELLGAEDFLALVDGSHPYAQVVSAQARQAAERAGVPYFRLGRPATDLKGDVKVFPDVAALAQFLAGTTGRIFSTLGSKEIDALAALPGAKERLVARVLPAAGVMEKCEALGLGAANLIAMMGPFSREMNEAMFKASGARWLVTKDGGAVGGMPEKLEAAAALGMTVLVVGRPDEGVRPLSHEGIIDELARLSGSSVLETGVSREEPPLPFPVFLNLRRPVLIVGGGPVACRRARGLIHWGCAVTLVSPSLAQPEGLTDSPLFSWVRRRWKKEDCQDVSLVVACTNDRETNRAIAEEGARVGLLVNRSDDRGGAENDFIFPALVRRGDDLAALSTAGASPLRCAALAGRLRSAWGGWCDDAPLGRPLRLGTRNSTLALAQTGRVLARLESELGLDGEAVPFCTTGDRLLDRRLDKTGGKGLFAREIEEALRQGAVDLAVHSLKDLPQESQPGLTFPAFCDRTYPFDCLVLRRGVTEKEVRRIGTSSRRRILQGKVLFPDASFIPLRGNVSTRLAKLDKGEFDALILAEAGLRRLGLDDRVSRVFGPDEMVPSAGQGALAVQCRDRGWAPELLAHLDDEPTRKVCEAERAFVACLGGGCTAPHGCYARLEDGVLFLEGLYVAPDGTLVRGSIRGSADEGPLLACRLAERLKG